MAAAQMVCPLPTSWQVTTGIYPVIVCQRRHSHSVTVAATGHVMNKWLIV